MDLSRIAEDWRHENEKLEPAIASFEKTQPVMAPVPAPAENHCRRGVVPAKGLQIALRRNNGQAKGMKKDVTSKEGMWAPKSLVIFLTSNLWIVM